MSEMARERNIFFPVFQDTPLAQEEFFSFLPRDMQKHLAAFAEHSFRGEEGEVKALWLGTTTHERIVLFGLGAQENFSVRKFPIAVRRMVQYARRERIVSFATPLLIHREYSIAEAAMTAAVNALMAHFDYVKYKEIPKQGWPRVENIIFSVDEKKPTARQEAMAGITAGIIIGEETNACRDLANTPGSDMTPTHLAAAATAAARRTGMTVKILNKRDMEKLGMGGVLGVARGSDEEPKFIILEYRHDQKNKNENQQPLVLVGKGVTFDTGGLNIKPDAHMYEMHMDMSGGAAVIFGMAAIARQKIPVTVIGLIPAVENMPSGSSYRPGDLLKAMNGKIIEVLNTDAEGRVILADALVYAARYAPGLLVDFATLTGAAHVALGHYASAFFTNRDELIPPFMEIGQRSGDAVWPLPLWDEYLADIKGTFGDLTNTGKHDRYGGAIHGAKFLEQFAGNARFAHVDIAPRMTTVESDCLAKGASGVGVRFIVELAKRYSNL